MQLLSGHILLREEKRFKEHYLPLIDDLFALAYRLVQDEAEARDIVQDVLTKLWQIRHELPPEGADKAYCLAMVRNRSIDYLRRLQTIPISSLDGADELESPDMASDGSFDQLEAQDYLDQLLKQLPARARQIIELRLRDGFSFKEIEQLTGIREGNARVILLRSLKQIRDEH